MSEPENQTPEPLPPYGAPSQTDQPVEEPARFGPLSRLTGTLLSPGETFADVNRKPTWLAAMIVVMVTGLVTTFFLEWRAKPDWERFFRTQATKALEKSGRSVPPEQLDTQIGYQVKFAKTDFTSPVSILFAILKVAIYFAIYCLIPTAIFALGLMLLQAQTTFKKILSVVSWATAATGMVGALVFIASLMVRDPESFRDINPPDIAGLVPTNLGVILPSGTSAIIASIAGSVDVFSIWLLILFAIGFAAISGARKMTSRKTGTLVFVFWACWVLVKAGVAAVFLPR